MEQAEIFFTGMCCKGFKSSRVPTKKKILFSKLVDAKLQNSARNTSREKLLH